MSRLAAAGLAWLIRILALAVVGTSIAAVIGTLHGSIAALGGVLIAAAGGVLALALWWTRPALAFACAAGLLEAAIAVGNLGGSEAGPRLPNVTSADVAAAGFAVALIVAALAVGAVLRSGLARGLAIGLAAYGLLGTLPSIGRGGLPAAFSTAPFAWTRGAYVAAEVLLPLAALVVGIGGIREAIRRRAGNAATAIGIVIVCAAGTQLGSAVAGVAGLPTLSAFEPGAATRSGDAAEADFGPPFVPHASEAVPPEVAAAAAALGSGPERSLRFVASLSDDFYPGALAGSVGALRSESANSVDKALLLRDLLRAGAPGLQLAFARCTLADGEADGFVAQARAGTKKHAKMLLQTAGSLAASSADPGVRATLARWSKTWTGLVAQTRAESARLTEQLQKSHLTLPSDRPAADRLRALAAAHVWLRANIDGRWTDLDPTIEPAAIGRSRCAATGQTADLPSELYDTLGTRIVVEEQRNGNAVRRVALAGTMRAVDVADRDVSFMFAEPLQMERFLAHPSPVTRGTIAYTPLLRVGDEHLAGTPIVLPEPPTGGVGSAVGDTAGDVAGALAAAPSTPAGAESPPPLPAISGAWLELRLAAPKAETVVVQRPIFDRIGYAARAAHAATVLTAVPDDETYAALQAMWNIVVSGGAAASGGGSASEIADGSDAPNASHALARLHSSYYGLRRALVDDARGGDLGVTALEPGISVLAMDVHGLRMDVSSDRALPLWSAEARPDWAAASVIAERVLIQPQTLLTMNDPSSLVGTDALVVLDRALANGSQIVALAPTDRGPPASAAIPQEAQVRMSTYLDKGSSLLASLPNRTQPGDPPYAFWIVDPVSGTLRDENAFGEHAEMVERGVTNRMAAKNFNWYRKLTCSIQPIVRAAVMTLSMAHGSINPFSLGGATGLGGANAAATSAVVKGAQAGLDTPVACGGP